MFGDRKIMKCPVCREDLVLKKQEAYKIFFICSSSGCDIVSVILTTTMKEYKEDVD